MIEIVLNQVRWVTAVCIIGTMILFSFGVTWLVIHSSNDPGSAPSSQ